MKKKYALYMIFAFTCTVLNLGSQALVEWGLSGIEAFRKPVTLFFDKYSLELIFVLKLVTGTVVGFLVKFLLDKFVVFKEKHKSASSTFLQMLIYGLLAVLTTLIFWSFQISFELIFSAPQMDLLGGLIGLAVGYTLKFFLDRRFVFSRDS